MIRKIRGLLWRDMRVLQVLSVATDRLGRGQSSHFWDFTDPEHCMAYHALLAHEPNMGPTWIIPISEREKLRHPGTC